MTSTPSHPIRSRATRIADHPASDAAQAVARREWGARAREIDHLTLSDPRAGLVLAERWLEVEPAGEGRARALRALAYALRFSGANERAHERFAEAERAFMDLSLPDELARTRIGHVVALRYLGRYDEAVELARQNLAYLESRGETFGLEVAKQTNNLGLVYWRVGDLRGALACFRHARAELRRRQERELTASASANIGLVLAELGRYGEALRAGQYAARHFRALGLRERLATVQINLGLLHVRRGEYARALEELEASRAICDELGLDHKRAEVDLDLTRTYLALNLQSEAAGACARAVATLRHLDLTFELAHALMRSGQVAERQGELDLARDYMVEAGVLFARNGSAVWEAVSIVQSVRLTSQIEDGTSLEELIAADRAAARLEALGALEQAAIARLGVGDVQARLGRTPEALASFRSAIAIGERLGADDVLRLAHTAHGMLTQDDAPDEALASFGRAVTHLERLRGRARADDLRMSVLANTVDLYERIAELLLRSDAVDRARDAFTWVERGKSRGLLEEALSAAERSSERSRPVVRRARERIKDLRARLNAAYTERYAPERPVAAGDGAADSDGIERLETELVTAVRQLQILLREDRVVDVSALQDVERVQAALASGTCLLEYVLLGRDVVCFVVTRESFSVKRSVDKRQELEEAAQWFWFHVRKGTYGADFLRANQRALAPGLGRALGRLGSLLLAPVAEALGAADHVVVVPHGLLHTLPFHALPYRDAALIDHATVSYAPSAGVFVASIERGDRRPSRPLVLAPDLPDLPWVGDEAARIAGLFPEAVVLAGRRATLGALRRHAPRCDALHLATHGVFRADNPTFSLLELADGWLSVGELAELSSGRSLVTLSACHTGMSGIGPGDEILGLTRAVLGGGSTALLAGLWAVNDDTAPALMEAFYGGLQRGLSRAASLREAMLAIRTVEPHPYFWAPFILFGAP